MTDAPIHVHPPTPPSGSTPATGAPSTGRGIGIASLATGIGSLVLVVFIGFLAGAVAVVLGIIGLKRPAARNLSIGGIITGALGMLLSIVVLIVGMILWAGILSSDNDNTTDAPIGAPQSNSLEFQSIETPCYEFDGPEHYINDISAADTAACGADLGLWGEKQDDGTILPTGVGAIYGSVAVEAVRSAFITENVPGGSLDDVQTYLESGYLLESGQSIISTEDIELDGVPAKLTYLVPNSPDTQLRAVITALPEQPYAGPERDLGLFLITVSVEESNGQEILDTLIGSWDWN